MPNLWLTVWNKIIHYAKLQYFLSLTTKSRSVNGSAQGPTQVQHTGINKLRLDFFTLVYRSFTFTYPFPATWHVRPTYTFASCPCPLLWSSLDSIIPILHVWFLSPLCFMDPSTLLSPYLEYTEVISLPVLQETNLTTLKCLKYLIVVSWRVQLLCQLLLTKSQVSENIL